MFLKIAPTIKPLTRDQLRTTAPSLFTERAAASTSSRYVMSSMLDVIDTLEQCGWLPVKASEQRTVKTEREGFQRHQVRFARALDLNTTGLAELRPEIVVNNAHDGTAAFSLDAGLYRLVCANGLTLADSKFETVRIRHSDAKPDVFAQTAVQIADKVPEMLEVPRRWAECKLSSAAQLDMARKAQLLRWPEGSAMSTFDTGRLLRPSRNTDAGDDLWRVFNRLQENIVRGGIQGTVAGARAKVRPLTGLHASQAFNKGLWALGAEFYDQRN